MAMHGQRTLDNFPGVQRFVTVIRGQQGTRMEVVNFPQQPTAPAANKCLLSCRFCNKKLETLKGLIAHERTHSVLCRPKNFEWLQQEAKAVCHALVDNVLWQCNLEEACRDLLLELIDHAVIVADLHDQEQRLLFNSYRNQKRKRDEEEERTSKYGRRGSKTRKSYTVWEKLQYVEIFQRIMSDCAMHNKGQRFEDETGVPSTNVIKWAGKADAIYKAAADERVRHLTCVDNTSRKVGKYAEMETILVAKLKERRTRGLRVSRRWLAKNAIEIMKITNPGVLFKAGKHWRWSFVRRHGLSVRKRTNCKPRTTEERIQVLRTYFRSYKRFMAQAEQQYCLLNVDQVPLAFVNNSDVTSDLRGAQRVQVNHIHAAFRKTQVTAQICVRYGEEEDGAVQPRGSLIFRGAGRISRLERESLSTDVDCYYQAKAWCDRKVAVDWVERTVAEFVQRDRERPRKGDQKYLMIQDNLDAQKQELYQQRLEEQGVKSWYVPANYTDDVQPVDRGIGRAVGLEMGAAMDVWLDCEDNVTKWEEGLAAWERRVLISHWFATALKEVQRKGTIAKCFGRSGALVHLKDVSVVNFEGMTTAQRDEVFSEGAVCQLPRNIVEPPPEDDDCVEENEGLDSGDDASEDEEPPAIPVPEGYSAAACPEDSDLAFKANTLVTRRILLNWPSVGWSLGTIVRSNGNQRKTHGGSIINYFVLYDADQLEAGHSLSSAMYGQLGANGWILLVENAVAE